jgi:hypothetical protein
MVEQNKELNGCARRGRLEWAHPNKGMNPTRVKRAFYQSCVRSRVIPGVRLLVLNIRGVQGLCAAHGARLHISQACMA